jgi:hypothetical protein
MARQPARPVVLPPAPARKAARRDVAGLAAQRDRAGRALEETRRALASGEIERAAEEALGQIEAALTSAPEAREPRAISARVRAVADRKAPAVPLGGIGLRLKVDDKVQQETATDALGFGAFDVDWKAQTKYEIEALAPDCKVLACQPGTWSPAKPAGAHLFELPRGQRLEAALARARPIEAALRKARERAELAREVAVKALRAQEKQLETYLAAIDAELAEGERKPDEAAKPEKKDDKKPRRR